MKDCQKIVVFTGAGISAESGISTFRDKNGLWENYDAMRLASIDGFRYDATWNYLRGVDSIAIDGAIYSIKRIFEYEEQYYYDTSVAVDYKISLS